MVFLFLAIALGILGEIFLVKVYSAGSKQLGKYGNENSNCFCQTAAEFAEKIRMIPDVEIDRVDSEANTVSFEYEEKECRVIVDNGRVIADYGKYGTGIRISAIGRIIGLFSFIQAAKKAFLLNALLDHISEQGLGTKRAYKVFRKNLTFLLITITAVILSLVIGIVMMTRESNGSGTTYKDQAIRNVQTSIYTENITYGELVDAYLIEPDWTAFNSEKDAPVVEVNGISVEEEDICIQFAGELGVGFQLVETQNFHLRYFEVDGKSLNPDEAIAYLYERYISAKKSNEKDVQEDLETVASTEGDSQREKRIVAVFTQVGLYDHDEYAYLGEEYVPEICLYSDGTFEFQCNFYEGMFVYEGVWKLSDNTGYEYKEYHCMVTNEPAIPNLDFYIMHNESRCDAEFFTDYDIDNPFGMTSVRNEEILFCSEYSFLNE